MNSVKEFISHFVEAISNIVICVFVFVCIVICVIVDIVYLLYELFESIED